MPSSASVRIYQRLPSSARTLLASLHGLRLWWWRYGLGSERLVAETLERDSWTADRWNEYQQERLAYILHRAATRVPYYREYWQSMRRNGARISFEDLEHWPILTKSELRANPRAFVADDCNPVLMYHDRTSGTTGTPVDQWYTKDTLRRWFATFEARARRWYGVTRHESWAILGGQPVVSSDVQHPPFWVRNVAMNQLYLSANHLSPRNAPYFIDALNQYQVSHLIAYTSSVAYLARQVTERGLAKPEALKVVITNAEGVLPWQREEIRQGLGCEVRETYGMAEMVAAASEDTEGKLRVWPEVGYIEVLHDERDEPLPREHVGRLICTSLLNPDMPLIRYEVKDRGALEARHQGSDANRLPVMSRIEGRENDLLVAPDGRRVYWINPIFYGLPISEAQVIQEELDRIRIRIVPAPGFSKQAEQIIVDRLLERLGSLHLSIEKVDHIPVGENGKFQPVINHVSESAYQ